MTKESRYYYCTLCEHIHLLNSEIGKLHIENSFKTQKQIKQMDDAKKGIESIGDVKLKKRIYFSPKRKKK